MQLHLALENHFLEELVLANVRANVLPDLAIGEQQPDAESIHPRIVSYGRKVLDALFHQSPNKVLGISAQPEAAHHDAGAIRDVVDCLVRIAHDFVHDQPLTESFAVEFRTVDSTAIEAMISSGDGRVRTLPPTAAYRDSHECAPVAVPA